MSTLAPEQKKPLLPPDVRFWQRYSPHHEFPLAGALSFFLHAVVVGIFGLAALLLVLRRESETNKPPRMDAVVLQGLGDGSEGKGGDPGFPGERIAGTELAPSKPGSTEAAIEQPPSNFLDAPKGVDLNLPLPLPPMAESGDNILETLAKLGKDAASQSTKETAPPQSKSGSPKISGSGNPKGTGGQGGSGGGAGKGMKGSGFGSGGNLGSGKATKQQIYAQRWRFDLSGSGKEHAAKLQAVGVIIGVADPSGRFLVITDLNRRPVHARVDNPNKYKDAVTWVNQEPGSVLALAKEVQLSFVPARVFLLLSKEREEKMAQEEADFARKQGRDPNRIQATWFDFRLQDGIYEPVVLRQE